MKKNLCIPNFPNFLGLLIITLLAALVGCAHTPTEPQKGAEARPVTPPAQTEAELHISAVGDIMLGGTAGPELKTLGYDYPFVYMRDYFQGSQVVFGNLEGPLTDRGTPDTDKKYVFRSPPNKVVPALKAAGFTIVSLANNHTMDYGAEGLAQTMDALDAAGIYHVGAGQNLAAARQPALLKIQGHTVAFLAYSVTLPESFYAQENKPGTAFAYEEQVRADVAQARTQADVVLVSFHWGQEGSTALRDYQPHLAHIAIDAGASAVIGHHPHILQGIERYKHGVILYSLGNFVFGSYSKAAVNSVIAQLVFRKTSDHNATWELSSLALIPIDVNNVELDFQPKPLVGVRADAVISELMKLSQPLATLIKNKNGIGVINFSL